jgi:hypothetical protein
MPEAPFCQHRCQQLYPREPLIHALSEDLQFSKSVLRLIDYGHTH